MFVDIIKAADLGWLATDNDQQRHQRLNANVCVSADGGHFEPKIWTM